MSKIYRNFETAMKMQMVGYGDSKRALGDLKI